MKNQHPKKVNIRHVFWNPLVFWSESVGIRILHCSRIFGGNFTSFAALHFLPLYFLPKSKDTFFWCAKFKTNPTERGCTGACLLLLLHGFSPLVHPRGTRIDPLRWLLLLDCIDTRVISAAPTCCMFFHDNPRAPFGDVRDKDVFIPTCVANGSCSFNLPFFLWVSPTN